MVFAVLGWDIINTIQYNSYINREFINTYNTHITRELINTIWCNIYMTREQGSTFWHQPRLTINTASNTPAKGRGWSKNPGGWTCALVSSSTSAWGMRAANVAELWALGTQRTSATTCLARHRSSSAENSLVLPAPGGREGWGTARRKIKACVCQILCIFSIGSHLLLLSLLKFMWGHQRKINNWYKPLDEQTRIWKIKQRRKIKENKKKEGTTQYLMG